MIKYFLLLIFPIFLSANLTYTSNYDNELSLLESFNIEPSFLNDPIMNEMKAKKSAKHKNKNQHFFEAMDDAYLFIPAVKNILSEYGVPPEFLYLAMAESNFSNKAYSDKNASGLWQFMPFTGKLFGLKIDDYVDERMDLVKSTRAAARHLVSLHKQFGKWYLAAIAYNCGDGRLERGIQAAKTDDLKVLLNPNEKFIPIESQLYIRKIIALALIGYDEKFLLKSEYEHLLNRASAYSVSTVKLAGGASLKRLSDLVGIPLKDLKKLNRHLKYDFVPPSKSGYDVYIPYIKLAEFKQKYYEEKNPTTYHVYTAKQKENVSDIARKYGLNMKVIMDLNKLKSPKLSLQQKLIIPNGAMAKNQQSSETMVKNKQSSGTITKNKQLSGTTTKNKQLSNSFYKVQSGDTLASIAKAHRVSIQDIKSQNNMTNNLLKIGDKLKIYE